MNTISPEETRLVELLLAKDGHDTLSADSAIEALQSSGLSPDVLATIWDLVDDGQKGFLSKDDLAKAVRVIGWAQRGFPVQSQRSEQPGPLAYFEGYQTPAINDSAFSILPPLSRGHKAKYQAIFNRAGPEKDLLSGYKVWETLVLSKLPLDTLTRIWDLVDDSRRGSLTMAEFCVAMYLVHGMLDGHFSSLPPAIPPHLREQAEEFTETMSPGVSNPAFTTDFYFIRASVDLDSWEIPSILRKHADSYFAALDQDGRGYLEGEQTVTFLLDSSLPAEDLSRIWDIIDSTGKGHLTPDDFALALFLVYKALAGIQIPSQLPPVALSYRQETQPLCDVDKPLLNKRHSELPPLPPAVSVDLSRELEVLRAQLEAMTQSRIREKTTLQHEIHNLQCSQHELMTENSELRLSLRNTTQSMRRSVSVHADKTTSVAAENANLRKQLRHSEELRAQMRNTHSAAMVELTQENHLLQAKLESLATSLESKTADLDVQRLVMDETTAEMERLRAQVAEMRDATTLVPEAGGDEDLQRMINEDLAKENQRFRAQVAQLAEALREVQTSMVPRDTLDEAKRVGRRLNRRVQEMEGRNGELQRQIEELGRRMADTSSSSNTGEAPPPAYQAIG